MDNSLVLVIVIFLGGLVALFLWINKKISELGNQNRPSDEILEYLKTTNTRLDEQNKSFNERMHESTKVLNERLDNAARVISDVQKNIGEMSEIGRSMKDLQEFLQSPKLRGNIGEQVLKELLEQMLPKQSFHLQYSFRSGEKVDAAIQTSAGMVPIDSKFPMENFRKMVAQETKKERDVIRRQFINDVRGHVRSISQKYILTDEGTIDYALMYVPSESVYYEVVNDLELFEYAASHRVLPVSPTTFYAYLRAILMSFEGQKIEAKAREVVSSIRAIQKDYSKVEDNLSTLQRHLNNAHNMMTNVYSTFSQLGQKISSTQSLGEGIQDEANRLDS